MQEPAAHSIQPSSVEELPAQPSATNGLDPRQWDGFTLSYAPRDKLRISPRLRLHTETAADIDPIAFEVIRSSARATKKFSLRSSRPLTQAG